MYLVMIRCKSDDIPIGLYRELADARRAAILAVQYPQECETIAVDMMDACVDWCSEVNPDLVTVIRFEKGVPFERVDPTTPELAGSAISAFTTAVWDDEDEEEWS
jgi:hypothetical protein